MTYWITMRRQRRERGVTVVTSTAQRRRHVVVLVDLDEWGVECMPYHSRAALAHSAPPSVSSAMRPIDHPVGRMSLDEYLAWEEQSPIRHEYVAGEVFAMSGVTVRHNLITLNIARALHGGARKRGCRVLATEVKLRAGSDRIYYPDIMLACGPAASVELIVEEPSLVVEVASRSTRAIDRREKLDAYMRLPSLRTYLIIEQRRRQVLAYTRGPDGDWRRDEINGSGDVRIDSLDATLSLDEIYDDVPLPPLSVGEQDDEDWYDLEDEPE